MTNIRELARKIAAIERRNARVEDDKAWETSLARRGALVAFTYIAVGAYLAAIGVPDPWLNAIVPAVAFMLSTLTLPYLKVIWLKGKRK
ncbi:MAG: hypothetical protein WC717_00955 [Candidatus Micrarchaeia archaeon]|jgi:hypothetical protein